MLGWARSIGENYVWEDTVVNVLTHLGHQ